jgi:predicted fused transcriptional regulator/phosphomethylpyrimidine kinase
MSFKELNDINKSLIPKIKRNQQRALNIRYDSKFYPGQMTGWEQYQECDPTVNIKNTNNRSANWHWIVENFFKKYEENKSNI